MSTTVVKLGSSIVVGDDGEVRRDTLEGVVEAVAKLHAGGERVVLVTSGAVARGMRLMSMGARPSGIAELQASSAVGQGDLYGVYRDLLRDQDARSAQVLLTFFDLASSRTSYLNARRTIEKLLEWEVVPVVNENDTTTTDEISFGDNDILAAQVAILLGADLLVVLTSTEGVFTADPRRDPKARLVEDVRDMEELEGLDIGSATSAFGSGGMKSKVVAAEMAAAAGIPTVVCDGTQAGTLERAVRGEREGTRFHPHRERVSSFKLWLRYAKPSHGRLLVDAGAARALRERGTSLLPVGIVEVEGEFDAGDAVEVAVSGDAGRAIGKGISNYSAAELRKVKGLKSAAVREVLPRATEEAVHRDYFVLG